VLLSSLETILGLKLFNRGCSVLKGMFSVKWNEEIRFFNAYLSEFAQKEMAIREKIPMDLST
jgi:hypothetical protein